MSTSTRTGLRFHALWLLSAVACAPFAGACGGSADYTFGDGPVFPTDNADAGFDALAPDAQDAVAQDAEAHARMDANPGAADVIAPPAPRDAAAQTPPSSPPAPPTATACPSQVPAGATMCCGAICCAPSDKEDPVGCVTTVNACQKND